MKTEPESFLINFVMIFNNVDFPAPLCPNKLKVLIYIFTRIFDFFIYRGLVYLKPSYHYMTY